MLLKWSLPGQSCHISTVANVCPCGHSNYCQSVWTQTHAPSCPFYIFTSGESWTAARWRVLRSLPKLQPRHAVVLLALPVSAKLHQLPSCRAPGPSCAVFTASGASGGGRRAATPGMSAGRQSWHRPLLDLRHQRNGVECISQTLVTAETC